LSHWTLGGSDPYIILDTDDVEDAAKTAWITRMENVGQACNSNKRMIVMDDIYDGFVAALVERATAMSPRQPGDDSPRSYSPMVSRKAAENLLAQVQDAVSKGATLHVGGTLDDGKGAYFAPAGRRAVGDRHGQRKHPGRRGRGPAVRRYQALRLRPRAGPPRHRRVRQ
jgi:acyl-CoA reductase-like NAD-dependent aldehyde dehydrogenase